MDLKQDLGLKIRPRWVYVYLFIYFIWMVNRNVRNSSKW